MDNIRRWHESTLEHALETRRVIVVSGARQCGKSTLLEMAFGGRAEIRSLDSKTLRDSALMDPQTFVRNDTEAPLVIDEIQKAPELLSEIKLAVDRNRRPGQYVVTGSSDIYSAPEVQESLAGRVKNIRMRTFTQGEIRGVRPSFIQRLFTDSFASSYSDCDKRSVLESAFRGGYPEAFRLSDADRGDWFADYLKSLFTRDMKDDSHIRRQQALYEILKSVAAWSSKFADATKLMGACGLSRPTFTEYLGTLERYYLCERVEAWSGTDYARVGKRPKWFVCDTGLMASVLNWRMKDVELDSDRSGKLVETFVFGELVAQVEMTRGCSLYQYRDSEKREIDFVVENADGDLVGIEVKAGSNVGREDFRHLAWFRDNLAKGRTFHGIVLYTGAHTLSFGDRLRAVPIATLWS